jgi:hypothetical protein
MKDAVLRLLAEEGVGGNDIMVGDEVPLALETDWAVVHVMNGGDETRKSTKQSFRE